MKSLLSALAIVFGLSAAVVGQDTLPIGTRVGGEVTGPTTPTSTEAGTMYDPVGHRDPFVSLVATKKGGGTTTPPRPKPGMSGVVLSDVSVRGIVHNGKNTFAVLEAPGGKSFVAHVKDKLQDATVKVIDNDGVTFVQQVVDVLGESHARDVRKSLRQTTIEEDR